MQTILALQKLEVAAGDEQLPGNSCTSSFIGCC